MQINLSEETIKTVWKALTIRKNDLEGILIKVEGRSALKEKVEYLKIMLSEVEEALQVFEEII